MATLAQPIKAQPLVAPTATTPGQMVGRILTYVVLIIVGLLLFTPFILAFLGTFKTDAEITAYPPSFFPAIWRVENWPRLWNTDVGGLPRPEGSASLGMAAGIFAFFGTFLIAGLSSEEKGKGLPRAIGLPVSLMLAVAVAAVAAWYVGPRINGPSVLTHSTGEPVLYQALIALGILSMSRPDWGLVVAALLGALVVGGLVAVLFDRLAVAAGGGIFLRWLFNTAVLS